MSECLQAYRLYMFGRPTLPHSGTECRNVSFEPSNSALQQCRLTCGSASVCVPTEPTKKTKPK